MRQNRKDAAAQEPSAPRRGRAGSAGGDIQNHVSSVFARAGFVDAALVLRWREIAGPDVARMAIPVKLLPGPEGDVLTLRSEPGAALFLQHQTRQLIEKLNLYLGRDRIARLRFVLGRINPGGDEAIPKRLPSGRNLTGAEPPKTLAEALENLRLRRISAGKP